MGGDSCDEELMPFPDDENGPDWELTDVPVVSHVHVSASLRQYLDVIREPDRSAKMTVPEDGSGVFTLALRNLNDITECKFAVAAKADALERVPIVKRLLQHRWLVGLSRKIHMVRECGEVCATVERLNSDSMGLHENVPGHETVQSQFVDAQHASPRFAASWR